MALLISLMLECVVRCEEIRSAGVEAPRKPFECPYRRKEIPTSRSHQVWLCWNLARRLHSSRFSMNPSSVLLYFAKSALPAEHVVA
jgi:hypothetical protein